MEHKGERCHSSKKGTRKERYNITAGLNENSLMAPLIFNGHASQATFEVYLEEVLAPKLRPGMVVVIDNASFHKSAKAERIIENVNCKIKFLPPYSPDLNPIEHHWAAVKNKIRKSTSKTRDYRQAAIEVLAEMCIS